MKHAVRILAVAALTLAWAGVCFAAEEQGAHGAAEGGSHGLPWVDFGLRLLNFAIVIGIIYKAAGKQIKEFFVGRQEQIKAELDDLTIRRKEAEAKLTEVEASIANIEEEKKAILEEYKAQGEALRESIVAEAHQKAELVASQAEMAVAQESKLAVERLKAEMADMVVDAAAQLLKKKLSKVADHQKLIDESLEKVVLN